MAKISDYLFLEHIGFIFEVEKPTFWSTSCRPGGSQVIALNGNVILSQKMQKYIYPYWQNINRSSVWHDHELNEILAFMESKLKLATVNLSKRLDKFIYIIQSTKQTTSYARALGSSLSRAIFELTQSTGFCWTSMEYFTTYFCPFILKNYDASLTLNIAETYQYKCRHWKCAH